MELTFDKIYEALVVRSTKEDRDEFLSKLPKEFAEKLETALFGQYLIENPKAFEIVADEIHKQAYKKFRQA